MTRSLIILGLFFSMGVADPVYAGTQALKGVPRKDADTFELVIKDFFQSLLLEGPATALNALQSKVKFQLEPLENGLKNLHSDPVYGPPRTYEIISHRKVGQKSTFYEVKVMAFHAQSPVGWRFKFYRPPEGTWSIHGIEFQTNYLQDFFEISELEYDAQLRSQH